MSYHSLMSAVRGILLASAFVGMPAIASAASQVVNVSLLNTAFQTCTTGGASCGGPNSFGFVNPSITVEYKGTVKDADTGLSIPLGGTVHEGQRITLECVAPSDTDISWFSAGSVYDSPYGAWKTSSFAGPSCTDRWYVGADVGGGRRGFVYGALALAKPSRSVVPGSGFSSCTTLSDGCSQTCTVSGTGTLSPRFDIGATSGEFYGRLISTAKLSQADLDAIDDHTAGVDVPLNTCLGSPTRAMGSRQLSAQKISIVTNATDAQNWQLQASFQRAFGNGKGANTSVPIPATVLAYALTVSTDPTGDGGGGGGSTPSDPTISAASAGSCIVGTPYTLQFSATSLDAHPLRYLIDWDGNGSIDELVPTSGYVPSGTVRTAARSYATSGTKSTRIAAQDDHGLLSGWKTFSFTCSGTVGTLDTDDADSGTIGTVGTVGTGDAPDLTLRAIPSLVKKGATTRLNWSATDVSSCTVSGTNGDSWNAIASQVGGQLSGTITRQTTFTLSCQSASGTLTKRAIVNVLPTWLEN